VIAAIHAAPWLGIIVVGAIAAALLAMLTTLQRLTGMPGEVIRKLFHLGGGMLALTLPWLFKAFWPVLMLATASLVVLVVIRLLPALRQGPGQILQAVTRRSFGEFWFVLGVVVVYAIARQEVVIYSIGILILTVADSAAALVGVVYGHYIFDVPGGTKSAEGSVTFFLMAFLGVHIPLLLFADVGRPESLLIAANVGLLAMFAEANAAGGADNFILPVLVVVFLERFQVMGAALLLLHAGVIVALGLFVMIYRKRTTLSADALIGAALVGYLFWTFGGWRWLVAPLVLFATYTWLVGRPRLDPDASFHADVLYAIAAPAVILVIAYAELEQEFLYLPYVAAWSSNLALIGTLQWQRRSPESPSGLVAGINSLKSMVVMVPGLLAGSHFPLPDIAATVLSVPATLLFFAMIRRLLRLRSARARTWIAVPLAVVTGTTLSFAGCAAIRSVWPL
jgi:phytol kinase